MMQSKTNLVIITLMQRWNESTDSPVKRAKEYVNHSPKALDFGAVDSGGCLFLGDFESYEFLKAFSIRCSQKSAPTIYRKLVGKAILRIINEN